jgi:hypothetical protein
MALGFLVRRSAAVQSVSLRSKLYLPTLQICQKKVSVKDRSKVKVRSLMGNDIGSKVEGRSLMGNDIGSGLARSVIYVR